MTQIAANPYINFQGHTREAMEFYQKALGGNLELTTFTPEGVPKPAEPGDRVMHSTLEVEGLRIMGSDGHPDYPPTVGDNMAIALSGTDRELLTKAFDLLAEDGTVKQALKAESWGDSFGYFVDKFGINWMVNINSLG
jgi:PhnB protein